MSQAVLLIFSLLPFVGCARIYLLERRAAGWPRLRGKIVEKPPQTFFERSGGVWYLNLDSDFFLEYEVDGKVYLHPADEKASARINGITIWRKPPEPDPWIRYDPRDPKQCFYENAQGAWKLVLAFAIAFALIVQCVVPGGFLATR